MDYEQELQQLRQEVRRLRERLDLVNQRIENLAAQERPVTHLVSPPPAAVVRPPPIPQPPPIPAPAKVIPLPPPPEIPVATVPTESFEIRLGTFWLPRIGIVLLLTGMVFFVTWIHPRLTAPYKVLLGYLCAAALGAFGWWLEKRMAQFARVLQAGALALAYFVTYWMHFSKSLHIIDNTAVALALLGIVVAVIVFVADRSKSPLLAGMALFLGYYTSVMSGVATFTLASNAVLAAAALFFLWRNRWVPISYGAVLATYVAYMLWVWKLNRFGDLEGLVFNSAYLTDTDFGLRAAFLSLYWLLFTAGGLIVHRDALNLPERNGLLTLNNVFFFVLFSLLMHHAYPGQQWQFQFCFGGALLLVSSLAYQRFKPERRVMDTLFIQGLAVATLGLISYFKGVRLVAALALESAFLLVLAQWMRSRWVAWIGRAAFAIAATYAWDRYPGWDGPMIWGVWFAALVGLVNARMESRAHSDSGDPPNLSATSFYFAIVSTVLAMVAAHEHFAAAAMPWVWIVGAIAVAGIGAALRTRETIWTSNLPLAWAHLQFYNAQLDARAWPLHQSLALIAVTFGFGVIPWGRARASAEDAEDRSAGGRALLLYALFATALMVATTCEHGPVRWRLTVFAVETLVLMAAGIWAGEMTFCWVALAPLLWAHGTLYFWKLSDHGYLLNQSLALIAATFACGLILWGRERAIDAGIAGSKRASSVFAPFAVAGLMAVIVTTLDHGAARWMLALFAAEALVFVIASVLAGEITFVWLGITAMGVGVFDYWLGESGRPNRMLTDWANAACAFMAFTSMERVLKRASGKLALADKTKRTLRRLIVITTTVLVVLALHRLVASDYLTVIWAVGGFVLLAVGFGVQERAYRLCGLAVLALSLTRAMIYDLGKLDVPYRILSFIGLGAILLVLAFLYTKNREKIAKWL